MAPIQPGDLNRQAVYVNAYACLKELNAFYLLQRRDASSSLLRMEYYDYGENEDLEAEVMESRQMYQAIAKDLSSKGVAAVLGAPVVIAVMMKKYQRRYRRNI